MKAIDFWVRNPDIFQNYSPSPAADHPRRQGAQLAFSVVVRVGLADLKPSGSKIKTIPSHKIRTVAVNISKVDIIASFVGRATFGTAGVC